MSVFARLPNSIHRALGVTASIATLAGCNGNTQLVAITSVQQSFTANARLTTVHPDRRTSWMEPDAKRGRLLYLSDAGTNDVVVYRYPSLVEAGVLTGFDEPQGECVDKAGNVWITNSLVSNVLEYAHGGTTAIATLSDRGQYPVGCSVDEKSGTLAVSNIATRRKHRGGLSLYTNATGTPAIITSPDFDEVYFVGYDGRGNLFLDGYSDSHVFHFGELANGSSTIAPITLSGATVRFPGGVQFYDGKVNVGDQEGAVIYRATETGMIAGSTPLNDSVDCVQFFILGKAVVCPDAGNGDIETYPYPAGGSPIQVITGLVSPAGAVVSN
ncbi:MAG: hypothetical protein WA304_00930 [Candidatus Cybelea sp.]